MRIVLLMQVIYLNYLGLDLILGRLCSGGRINMRRTFEQACKKASSSGKISFFWFILNWAVDLFTYDDIKDNNKDLFKWAFRGNK